MRTHSNPPAPVAGRQQVVEPAEDVLNEPLVDVQEVATFVQQGIS